MRYHDKEGKDTERIGVVHGQAAYLECWQPAWPLVEQGASAGVVSWHMVTRRGSVVGGGLHGHGEGGEGPWAGSLSGFQVTSMASGGAGSSGQSCELGSSSFFFF